MYTLVTPQNRHWSQASIRSRAKDWGYGRLRLISWCLARGGYNPSGVCWLLTKLYQTEVGSSLSQEFSGGGFRDQPAPNGGKKRRWED